MYVNSDRDEDINVEDQENMRINLISEANVVVYTYCKHVTILLFSCVVLQLDQFCHFGIVINTVPWLMLESGTFFYYFTYYTYFCEHLTIFFIFFSLFDLTSWVLLIFCMNPYRISIFYILIPFGLNIVCMSIYTFKFNSSVFKIFEKVKFT